MTSALPTDYPLRGALNDEVHARPPESLEAPARLTYLALLCDPAQADASSRAVHELAARYDAPKPEPGASHYSADFGLFRLKWERHTEFVRYTFIVQGDTDATALAAVPGDWVAGLPGELVVADHVILERAIPGADPVALAARLFQRDQLIGSALADETATAFADFRIRASGFGRILVVDRSMTPWQAGRLVQALLEIDTYRMMALLAFPVARALGPLIARREHELSEITTAMVIAGEADESPLLERLTRLAAEIDSGLAENLYRFNAAAAYHELVRRRIDELRETRLAGLQTLQEFTERRLAPAMTTCVSIAGRQEELSRRVARATQLLATRVGVTRERQNQTLLDSVNRRVRLQIRLQSTVEGLSVAAVTYYIVGLVGYAAKGLEASRVPIDPTIAMGLSIPIIGLTVALGLRRMRRRVEADDAS